MVAWSFSSFLQINSSIFCTPYRRMCRTRSARYCHTRILQGFSYCILPIDQLLEDDFLCTVADVIHSSDPCQLIPCFQLLIDTSFFCQLRYEQVELIASLSVNVCEVAVQLATENQIGIQHRAVFFNVIQVLPTPDADRASFGIRQNQTRDVVISMQLIPKSVAAVIDVSNRYDCYAI